MPTPDEVRRMIDEALAEIDRVEAEVEEILTEVLGPTVAAKIKKLGESHAQDMGAKLPKPGGTTGSRPEASPGSSAEPPATR